MSKPKYISEIIFNDSLRRDSYLKKLPIIIFLSQTGKLELFERVTFFVGENGTGK